MLIELKKRGYFKASLSVQKANYATKMYKSIGIKFLRKIMKIILCFINFNRLRKYNVQNMK